MKPISTDICIDRQRIIFMANLGCKPMQILLPDTCQSDPTQHSILIRWTVVLLTMKILLVHSYSHFYTCVGVWSKAIFNINAQLHMEQTQNKLQLQHFLVTYNIINLIQICCYNKTSYSICPSHILVQRSHKAVYGNFQVQWELNALSATENCQLWACYSVVYHIQDVCLKWEGEIPTLFC